VRNFAGLVAMRVLIGIFEAGLMPGRPRQYPYMTLPYLRRMYLFDFNVLSKVRASMEVEFVLQRQYHCRSFLGCECSTRKSQGPS
jgi:hypothetical protein